MIGVLTLFGDVDLQPVLKKIFMKNDLIFVSENSNTSVQLLDKVSEHFKETDVVIIAANAVNLENIHELVAEIREKENRMNIILILNGNKEQYLESQIADFRKDYINIIYDDDGFDTNSLIDMVKTGKIVKTRKKHISSGTGWDIDKVSDFIGNADKKIKKNIEKIKKNNSAEKEIKDSFSRPKCKYRIGILNATHGAGATTVCINLARYFAFHNYETKLIDLSGSKALELINLKDVQIGIGSEELNSFKRDSNILIIDFGTPYDITPNGDNFKISSEYPPEYIREINKCNIKIILGFSDVWNVGKIKFFLSNRQWQEMINDSFVFMVSGDEQKLKREHPGVNIMNREDDFKDEILKVVKGDEYL